MIGIILTMYQVASCPCYGAVRSVETEKNDVGDIIICVIFIGKPIPFEVEEFLQQLEELANASYETSPDIVSMVEKNSADLPSGGRKAGWKGRMLFK